MIFEGFGVFLSMHHNWKIQAGKEKGDGRDDDGGERRGQVDEEQGGSNEGGLGGEATV